MARDVRFFSLIFRICPGQEGDLEGSKVEYWSAKLSYGTDDISSPLEELSEHAETSLNGLSLWFCLIELQNVFCQASDRGSYYSSNELVATKTSNLRPAGRQDACGHGRLAFHRLCLVRLQCAWFNAEGSFGGSRSGDDEYSR